MNAMGLDTSAVGNHEFDQGWDDLRYDVLEQVILGNPQLGLLTTLLNLPPEAQACPNNIPPDNRVP